MHIKKTVVVSLMMVVMLFGTFTAVPKPAQAATYEEQVASLLEQIQGLMQILASLKAQVASMEEIQTQTQTEATLSIKELEVGDTIMTTSNLRVRSGAGTGYNWVNNVALGTKGELVAGPKKSDGYTWWLIRYESGTQGWSVESWLNKIADYVEEEVDDKDDEEVMDDEDESIAEDRYSKPSCEVWTNKSSYEYMDDVTVSWKSENANYGFFVEDQSGKESLQVGGDKMDTKGTLHLDASVLGNPSLTFKVVDSYSNTATCSTKFEVYEKQAVYKAVLNNKVIKEVAETTKAEAQALCKEVYNDYGTYNFQNGDVLECYWNGEEFLTIDSWKG